MSEIETEDLPKEDQHKAPSEPVANEVKHHMLIADRFNVPNANEEEENKLREIWSHASTLTESNDPQSIMWEVLHLQRSIGAPKLGETSLDKLYRWAKLKRMQQNIEEELKSV